MKYINFAIVACMAAIALFSCETFNPEDVEEVSEEVVITASVRDDSSDTKSAIDEIANNKVKFTWLAGDAINVFFGASEGSIFVTEATARVAQFKGSITGVTGGGDDLTDETSLWGVYPYDKNTTSDGSSITLTLPHSQDAKEDNLADDLYPSIARSTNFTMAFSPVCGSLRFKVTNSDIVKVTLRGNNGEDLAGKAKISMPLGGKPAVSEILEGQKELVMTAPEGGCFVPGKWYYFVLYPTGFSEGFTLTFYNESGLRGSFVREAAFPVARNMFYSAIDKDAGLTFTKIGYDYIDENGINQGPGIEIDGVMWAPVNCGYHKTDYPYGKLYQWGRKYGQGYKGPLCDWNGNKTGDISDATYPSSKAGTVSLVEGQSKANEDVFFYGLEDNNFDWVYPSDDNLWNSGTESAPIKNKDNDPCPDGWRVPTYSELSELCENDSDWTSENGRSGYLISGPSTYGEDIRQVFFPAAGYRPYPYENTDLRGARGYYWSSRPYGNRAYILELSCVYLMIDYFESRAFGLSVRCVKDANSSDDSGNDVIIPVSTVTLSSTSLKLYEGSKAGLTAKVKPTYATNPTVTWSSDAPSIASVGQNGVVTAISTGSATITATADGVSNTCTVTVSSLVTADYVDEYGENHGNGVAIGMVIWAPVNCGYHKTDYPYGKLYQWGRMYGQGYDGSDATYPSVEEGTIKEGGVSLAEGQSATSKDVFFLGYVDNRYDWVYPSDDKLWNSGTESAPIKNKDNDPCPSGWRVPTYAELYELSTNHSDWISNNGQSGYWFSGVSTYAEDIPQVFFPAAGSRSYNDGAANNRGSNGSYWSSRPSSVFGAYRISFHGGNYVDIAGIDCACGYSVRCVQE